MTKWDSGIYLKIAPNDGSVERVGNVTIRSFLIVLKFILKISHWVVYIMETQDFANTIRCIIHSALIMVGVVC